MLSTSTFSYSEPIPASMGSLFFVSNVVFSRDVRKAVLTAIGMSTFTAQHVLTRTKDVNDDVRKMTYTIFGKKVPMDKLTAEDRVTLLKDGLNDRYSIF